MAFQVSPGVEVKEIDLTTIIPAVSTTRTGFAGLFQWGPVGQRITVTGENSLVEIFNKPNNTNYAYWFTAANFLGYANNLQVVRVLNRDTSKNASVDGGYKIVLNADDYESEFGGESGQSGHSFIAKYPGTLGNSLKVSVSDRTHTTLTPVFADPGATTGFDTSSLSTTTTTSTFYHTSTQGAVANEDLLRFGRGTPKTITSYTASSSVGTIPVGFTIGSSAAAGLTFIFNDGGITTGSYVKVEQGGVVGFGYVDTVTAGGGSTHIAALGPSGFGFASGTTATSTLSVYSLGTIQTGSTFSNAGSTYAEVLWKYYNQFSTKLPSTSSFVERQGGTNDLLHAIVIDEDGDWTGTKNTVLEKFESLSKGINVLNYDNTSLYYKTVINENSKYIWWGNHLDQDETSTGGSAWGTESSSEGITWALLNANYYASMTGGSAGAPEGNDFYTDGYELFADAETVDISLILGGPQEGVQAQSIIDMCDARKDCVAFLSPPKFAVLNSTGNSPKTAQVATANVLAYRDGVDGNISGGDQDYTTGNLNKSSSYAFLDNGWKYMYDRYNDVFRFVPLNADVAGIAARSDEETETWFSPAGYNRGQLRNVVKLAYNPLKAQRDDLYSAQVNPVVSFPGEGTLLFGDKTLQSKPSAFDRLNVRRLFIVLEKAIATASKFSLFEQNDSFTRASFKQLVEPFLRDVQARRGIIDFKVVCDESNNTGEIIDRNEFVADIFIKPTRSINYITLNFIATRTAVDFDEIGGVS